jgi:hypothetical protein
MLLLNKAAAANAEECPASYRSNKALFYQLVDGVDCVFDYARGTKALESVP